MYMLPGIVFLAILIIALSLAGFSWVSPHTRAWPIAHIPSALISLALLLLLSLQVITRNIVDITAEYGAGAWHVHLEPILPPGLGWILVLLIVILGLQLVLYTLETLLTPTGGSRL